MVYSHIVFCSLLLWLLFSVIFSPSSLFYFEKSWFTSYFSLPKKGFIKKYLSLFIFISWHHLLVNDFLYFFLLPYLDSNLFNNIAQKKHVYRNADDLIYLVSAFFCPTISSFPDLSALPLLTGNFTPHLLPLVILPPVVLSSSILTSHLTHGLSSFQFFRSTDFIYFSRYIFLLPHSTPSSYPSLKQYHQPGKRC